MTVCTLKAMICPNNKIKVSLFLKILNIFPTPYWFLCWFPFSTIQICQCNNSIRIRIISIFINPPTWMENLKWIRFNLSVASDEAYRRVHNSTKFSIAIEKIKFAVAAKINNNLKLTVGLQMVLTPNNIDQVVPLAKLGRELGVDYFVIKQCSDTVENALGVYKTLNDFDNYESILKEAENISSDDYNVIAKWNKITNKGDANEC